MTEQQHPPSPLGVAPGALDLDALERQWIFHGPHPDDALVVVRLARAQRAELAALAAERDALREIEAIARRWADADTPTLAIKAAMDLRAALAGPGRARGEGAE